MAYIKATERDLQIARRLREIREELFGPKGQAEMARFLSVSPESYRQYETARVRLPNRITTLLCEKKKISPVWVLTGKGSKFLDYRTLGMRIAEALFEEEESGIPVLASVGAGGPYDIDELEPVGRLVVDEHFTTPGMVALKVRGDSMETGIPDGAIVGVDTRKRTLKDLQTRGVYVLGIRNEGVVIRRLYISKNKTLSFIPDNPTKENPPYTYTYTRKERRYSEEPIINGRVVWVLNKLDP